MQLIRLQLKSDIDGLLETIDDAENTVSADQQEHDNEEEPSMDDEEQKSMKDEAAMVEVSNAPLSICGTCGGLPLALMLKQSIA